MSTNSGTSGITASSNFLQVLEREIDAQLGSNFSVLGSHPSAHKIIMGVIGVETGVGYGWRAVNLPHQLLPATVGFGKAFEAHHVVKANRNIAAINQANLTQGRQAHSLLGCMGAYLIRGLHQGPKGFPHVQSSYSSVAESVGLLVSPGESISEKFTQDVEGLRRGLVAGMCVLEYNYKIYTRSNPGDKDLAMRKTVSSHLGDPNAFDVVTGINSSDYLARVMNTANGYARSTSTVTSSSTPDVRYSDIAKNSVKNSPDSSGVTTPGSKPGCVYS